jgi:hypothetical protein
MIKLSYLLIPITLCFLLGCNPEIIKNVRPHPDAEGKESIEEDGSIEDHSEEPILADTFPVINSNIVEASLNGLDLIEETWNQTILYTDTNVEFLLVRPTRAKTIVAIASSFPDPEDFSSDFFFYELNLDGSVISKKELYATDYSSILNQNLQEINGSIHYFRKKNLAQEWVYDLTTKTHKLNEDQKLDWEAINDWKKQRAFTSPDTTKTILLQTSILSLISEDKEEQLIKQLYDGSWAFGSGCWSTSGNTFFFDNSGATACIWKIDLIAKTLAKIVPEHEAKKPVLFEQNGEIKIIYCEGSCIKIASQ